MHWSCSELCQLHWCGCRQKCRIMFYLDDFSVASAQLNQLKIWVGWWWCCHSSQLKKPDWVKQYGRSQNKRTLVCLERQRKILTKRRGKVHWKLESAYPKRTSAWLNGLSITFWESWSQTSTFWVWSTGYQTTDIGQKECIETGWRLKIAQYFSHRWHYSIASNKMAFF